MTALGRLRRDATVRLGGATFRYVRCLKRDFFAENHLLEAPTGGLYVVKRARTLGFLAARERARYRRAAGLPGVPRLSPSQGELWLMHEWVEGRTLDYGATVAADFYDRLEALVQGLHARGIIHLDLHKPGNILITEDGRPALIDFQIAQLFAPARGPLAERVFAALARADLYQVYKHRRRHGHARDARDERLSRERSALHLFHRRFVRDPWRAVKHRVIPRGW